MEDKITEFEQLKIENKLLKKKLNETKGFPFHINVFKKALNNISDCVFILTLERIFLFANDGFNKTLGYQNESVVGQSTSIIFGESTGQKKYDEIYKAVLDTGWEGILSLKKKSGEEIPVQISANIIRDIDGNEDAIFVVAKDLTEQLAKDNSLQVAKDKYLNLFYELKNTVYESSPDGKLLDINPAGVKLFGFNSKEELMDVNIAKDLYVNPKDRETLKDEIERNGFIKNYEIKVRNNSGEIIVVLETSTTIRDSSGRITSYQGILRDITEEKKREKLMSKYVSDLAEVNAQLRNSEVELKQLNAEKDKFFSIIAHDLKSPFNSLLNLSEFLVEDISELTMEEVKSFSKEINKSAHNVFNHIENLLQWSQIKTGGLEQVNENVALSSFVNNTLALIEGNAAKKNISVQNDIDTHLFFTGDRNMINSVFLNLITNSIKFTQRNGLIKIVATENEDTITVMVMDNGIGINKNNIDKLFKIDKHFSTSGTLNELGTGLGLILCKELIEKNNGKIWVKSEEGIGTTFFFTLPKAEI